MKKSEKSHDTGLRVFKVLEILLSQDISKKELIEQLRDSKIFENIYTPEAFIKYFNTLDVLGFSIEKNKNIYRLKNALFKVEISKSELLAFYNLIKYIQKLHNKSLEEVAKLALLKIIKYTEPEIQDELYKRITELPEKISEADNLILSLESFLSDGQLVLITYYKNSNAVETITCEIKEVIEKKNGIFISCYDITNARNKNISVKSIVSVKSSPLRGVSAYAKNSTVFRLYGRLAVIYKLKQSEKVIDFSNDYITISNLSEDRDVLLKRLLKYGESCKIVKPKSLQQEYIKLVDEILANLEGN